jgi:hypothetical protein
MEENLCVQLTSVEGVCRREEKRRVIEKGEEEEGKKGKVFGVFWCLGNESRKLYGRYPGGGGALRRQGQGRPGRGFEEAKGKKKKISGSGAWRNGGDQNLHLVSA